MGTLTVSRFNAASVFSAVVVGLLIDRYHVTTVILISCLGAIFSVFVFWGFATSLPLLCIFAINYGLFAGGFSCTFTGVVREVKTRSTGAESGMVFGILSVGRRVGAVVAGPLSAVLLNAQTWGGWDGGYRSIYGPIIIFTGLSVAFGSASFVAR